MRKGYRPFRNRAIVYTLIESGMRRAAVRNIDLAEVDFIIFLESVDISMRYIIIILFEIASVEKLSGRDGLRLM